MDLAPADTFDALADEIVALSANIHGAEHRLIEMARETTAEHVARRVRARRQADLLAAPEAALNAWKQRYLDCHTAHEDCGRAQAAEGGCADRMTREQDRHMNCRTVHASAEAS